MRARSSNVARLALWYGIAAALSACSGGSGTDGNGTAATNVVSSATPTPTPGDSDDGPPVVSPTFAPEGSVAIPPDPPREGRWRAQSGAAGLAATFGRPGGDGMFSVSCDRRAGALRFHRAVEDPELGRVAALNLSLPAGSTLVRAFHREPERGGYVGAMPVRAPWLAKLLAAGGTLESDLEGRTPLSVPVSRELKHVVAGCRAAVRKGRG